MYATDLHQIFTVGRSIDLNDKSDIHFAVVLEMLLW